MSVAVRKKDIDLELDLMRRFDRRYSRDLNVRHVSMTYRGKGKWEHVEIVKKVVRTIINGGKGKFATGEVK